MAGWKLTGNHPLHPTQTIIPDLDLIVVESKVSGGCELDQRNEINYAIIVGVFESTCRNWWMFQALIPLP